MTVPLSRAGTLARGPQPAADWVPTFARSQPSNDVQRRLNLNHAQCKNATSALTITTYDGSGQSTEPTVTFIPTGWNGHKWWGCFTAYPAGAGGYEDPAVYYSDDGLSWTNVPGAPFPLIQPYPSNGQLCDPEILLHTDNYLYIFFFQSNTTNSPTTWARMWTRSADGINWSTPQQLWTTTTALAQTPVGGAMLFDGTNWNEWWTDAQSGTTVMYRMQSPNLTSGWSLAQAQACTINGLATGRHPWEQHVAWYGDQMLMLLSSQSVSAPTWQLEALTSSDGLTWTCAPSPLLTPNPGASAWDNTLIYRADLIRIDQGGGPPRFGVYYSAKSSAGAWNIGYTEAVYPDQYGTLGRSFTAGRLYTSDVIANDTTMTPTLNDCYWSRFSAGQMIRVATVGLEVTTGAASSVIRIGLYDGTGGVPGALLVEFTATTQISGVNSGFQSLTLPSALCFEPGQYFIGTAFQGGTPTVRARNAVDSFLGQTPGVYNANVSGFACNSVSGALPAVGTAASGFGELQNTVPKTLLVMG